MIKIDNIMTRIMLDFENAIVDLEALNSYFIKTRDFINSKKIEYKERYGTAYELSKILDRIYAHEENKRDDYIKNILSCEVVDGIKVKDMIEISLSDDQQMVRYSKKDQYRKKNLILA